MKIFMGDRWVGDDEPSLIVAEIAANHRDSVDLACSLIQEAALAGADAVKFQSIDAGELFNPSNPTYSILKSRQMPLSGFSRLIETAKGNNVLFFSTPFDEVSADFLEELDVPFYKIGSGELTHHRLLRHVARKGKPVVISSGMAEQEQIDNAIRVVKETGNEQIILTHCVSVYPAPVALANVRAVPALRERLGVLTGYSDHTGPSAAPLAAVALGACYIEKHFSISRALPGGDNSMSTEPSEFKAMVQGIREVESSLGTPTRSLLTEESGLVAIARRGIYARNDIAIGQRIDSDMLAVRRPLSEIAADQIDQVVGRVAKVSITAEEGLTWDQLGD